MTTFVLENPLKGLVLLAVFLAGLLWFTIFQMNALTALVYHMGDQEKRIEQLKDQSLTLEPQHLLSFSRTQMEELAQNMQFVRVQEVSYLKILGNSVATTTNQE